MKIIIKYIIFINFFYFGQCSLQAFNPNNPFVYPVPPVLSIIATNPFINKSQIIFNEPFENEERRQIGEYHYHIAKECGVHFLNLHEGFIINNHMFRNSNQSLRCVWGFVGSQFCTPSIECPKFIPTKKRIDCRQNYLQISDDESFSLHFCDKLNSPGNKEYTSTSGILDITYRYTKLYEKQHFECFVKCVPYKVNFTTSINSNNITQVKIKSKTKQYLNKLLPPRMRKDCKCGITNSQESRFDGNHTNIHNNNNNNNSNHKNSRVLGGRETEISQYPWMVGLVHKGKILPFCGASLINDRYVLTAAHCLDDEELDDFEIILNEHDYLNDTETYGKTIKRGIIEMIPYQYYLESTFSGDIALLVLDNPIDITNYVFTPICLPPYNNNNNNNNTYTNYDVIGAGWGTLTENGQKSPKLLEVLLKVINNAACNDYHSSKKPEPLQVTDNMICAGYPEGGRDTCSGDSGGPLITYENKHFIQIGVTSWGFGCGVKLNPGIFSRVTSFLNWIHMHTPDAIWCH